MEKISALMDGELDEHQAQQQLQRLKQNEGLTDNWHAFHLIGDVMRDERALSPHFSRRLARRFSTEPTVLAPRRITAKRATAYALSAAASLSAIALVGWVAVSTHPVALQGEMAAAPVTSVPAVASVVAPSVSPSVSPSASAPVSLSPAPALASVPSEGTMNEYLMAHQEYSPSTALQGVAPYIRSVSSTRQSQGR
jgi:sigma-E factor negative regulatory protein RseA